MKMFIGTNVTYDFNDHSIADPFPSSQSMCSSFSSNSSTDEYVLTPASTPPHHRTSTDDSFKLEESYFPLPTPSATPSSFGTSASFGTISLTEQEMMTGFDNQPMVFTGDGSLYNQPNMMGYNFFSNVSTAMDNMNDGLPSNYNQFDLCTPASTFDSTYSEDFVNPSQTTFLDMQSPLHANPLSFELRYDLDSPDSDCQSYSSASSTPIDRAIYGSVRSDSSSPSTPTRTSRIRQPLFRPLPSSLALHRIQSEREAHSSDESQRLHLTRRRMKHEVKDCFLPNNVSRLAMASKPCVFPGCQKKFRRQEHLKRHEKVHKKNLEPFPCEFCGRNFSRSDNLKSHIKLHADPKKISKRTEHFGQAAMDVWLSMSSKPRKLSDRTKVEVKEEKRSPKSRASRL